MTDYAGLLAHLDRPGAYKGTYDRAAAKAIRELEDCIAALRDRSADTIRELQEQVRAIDDK